MMKINQRFKSPKFYILCGLVLVLLIIYILICFIAGSNDYFSNTKINGIDVSNMTKEEAASALSDQYETDCKDLTLVFKVADDEYSISLKDNVSFDASSSAQSVYDKLHQSFFMKGYYYLFKGNFTATVTIKDTDALDKNIQESKILEYDTKVDTTYEINEDSVTFIKGEAGEKVELEDIQNQISEALENYDFKDTMECRLVKSEPDEDEMNALYEEICHEPINATLDKDNDYALVDAKVGVDFDLEDALSEFNKTGEGKEFSIDATITQPEITKEMLEKNLFKDTLGSYTTYVSGTSVRKSNVKLAGSKCNGVILLPGEEFSYNDVVGERTKANGFGEAAAYLNGETIQEVGGGVCQPSSTLYNAVVLSNLEVTERHNHTYVSGYVPLGRDATVSWNGPDFKFKNNTDYPIKVVSSYSNSRLTMKIIGTDLENITVEFVSESLSYTPYNTIEKKDNTLEEGKTKVDVTGYNGAKAQTYRKVYKDGELISTTKEAYSVYSKRDKIVLVGTKKKEETKQEETTKPEENTTEQQTKPEENTTQPETTKPEDTTQ